MQYNHFRTSSQGFIMKYDKKNCETNFYQQLYSRYHIVVFMSRIIFQGFFSRNIQTNIQILINGFQYGVHRFSNEVNKNYSEILNVR